MLEACISDEEENVYVVRSSTISPANLVDVFCSTLNEPAESYSFNKKEIKPIYIEKLSEESSQEYRPRISKRKRSIVDESEDEENSEYEV